MRMRGPRFHGGWRRRRHRNRWHGYGPWRWHPMGVPWHRPDVPERIRRPAPAEGGVFRALWRRFHGPERPGPAEGAATRRRGYPSSKGLSVSVDLDRCVACGTCEQVCPNGGILVDQELFRVDPSQCSGCGLCVARCPQGALSLNETRRVFHYGEGGDGQDARREGQGSEGIV